MFLDPLINALRKPLDFVRTKVFRVDSVKGGFKGDVNRLKATGNEYKNAVGDAKAKAQKVKAGGDKAKAGAAAAGNGKKKTAKMGLFSKKKLCPACNEKLHASWDQCPYCGWSEGGGAPAGGAQQAQAPAGQPQQKMRTMAMDAPSVGGGGGGVGWLVPLDGPQSGELFQLKGRSVVGTAPDCDVVMRDPSISGRHCELTSSGSGFRLSDLGSTNGTFVNDKRVQSTDLIDNDSIRLGRVNFKFKSMS